ncbi:hypothetical protein, partial [Mycobacterium sp.]|uniref:hypothetical protein n=1 Tax=Mycobacterium sp. TaxID=1785 RepID=UPI003A895443
MRRNEAEHLGIHLPVLPTMVLGGLPGEPTWAARLQAIGLDVVSSGAVVDTADTVMAAAGESLGRPVKAVAGDAAALAAAGARIIEGAGTMVAGAYRIDPGEALVAVVDGG